MVFVLLKGMRFFLSDFFDMGEWPWFSGVPSKHVAIYNSRKMVWVVAATPDFEVARQARPIDM